MTNAINSRLRKDGSIDTLDFIARAQVQRSEAAHNTARNVCKGTYMTIGMLAVIAANLPFLGGQS